MPLFFSSSSEKSSFDLCSKHQRCFKDQCSRSCCLICPNTAVRTDFLHLTDCTERWCKFSYRRKISVWDFLLCEVPWVLSPTALAVLPQALVWNLFTALWAIRRWDWLWMGWTMMLVENTGERRDNQRQPTVEGSGKTPLRSSAFPAAHHPTAFPFLNCAHRCHRVSGIWVQPGKLASTWDIPGLLTTEAPPALSFILNKFCAAPLGRLDQLVRGLDGWVHHSFLHTTMLYTNRCELKHIYLYLRKPISPNRYFLLMREQKLLRERS